MEVYAYEAALVCAGCAKEIRAKLHRECVAVADMDGNSDMAPQGPYSNGGGEADTPQHCDFCGEFLENPLTDDGRAYVAEKLADGSGDADVLAVWREFYGAELGQAKREWQQKAASLRDAARSYRRSAAQMERHRGLTGDVLVAREQAAAWDVQAAALEARAGRAAQ